MTPAKEQPERPDGAADFRAHWLRLVRLEGPQPVARLMAEAIGHYYATRDPFGAAGDFVTAPEISQVFGELIGLWAADLWDRMGRPGGLRLVELGPGRGTLMADALRAAERALPAFAAAADLHLVEASARLRQVQRQALADRTAAWHNDLDAVPPGPAIILANEFLDALPVRQLVRSAESWHERLVAADGEALCFALSPPLPDRVLALRPAHRRAPPGSVVELAPAREAMVRRIGTRIGAGGGAALLIDYGAARSGTGDTLQAVRAHRFADVLATIGAADLTSQVDFQALVAALDGSGVRIWGPVGQGAFLQALGIATRAAALKRGLPPEQAERLDTAVERLVAPAAMGTRFLVLGIAAAGMPSLAGF